VEVDKMHEGLHRVRSAFSRLEIVASVLVLLVVLALLPVAMLDSRQDSRDRRRENGFRQLGVSVGVYHETYGRFPSGLAQGDTRQLDSMTD